MKAHWIPQMNRAGTARRYVLNLGDGYKAYVSKDANTDGRTYLWAIMGPRLWPAGQVQQDGIIHLRDESNGHAFQTKEAAMLDFEKIMPRWKREFRHLLPMQEKPPIIEAGETALILGDQLRIETGLSVARKIKLKLAAVGQDSLLAVAVPAVAGAAFAAEMMVHLRVQSSLGQRLF